MNEPLLDVTEVHPLPRHQLTVTFEDGVHGRVDLSERLVGPVFGPLRDESLFGRAYIEYGTVVWRQWRKLGARRDVRRN